MNFLFGLIVGAAASGGSFDFHTPIELYYAMLLCWAWLVFNYVRFMLLPDIIEGIKWLVEKIKSA